ncbi:MAG TPA: hypothetical protein VKR78_02905, partial [Acidimicrobiales bacterium]|nr:hypothetical protein [Acidimicrobiales bacterium]
MNRRVVILRGAPAVTERQRVGREHRGPSLLHRRLATYLYAAGDADAEEDRFGLGAVLVALGPSILHALVVVPDAIAPSALAEVEAWAQSQRATSQRPKSP